MNLSYKCKKCIFSTSQFCNIVTHLNKKKQCEKDFNVIEYSDDQLLILSILPYFNNIQAVKDIEIGHLNNNSNIINKNKTELFDYIKKINVEKCKICNFCNEKFIKIEDLKKHIIINCFFKELKKRIESNDKKIVKIDTINNNKDSYNITDSYNTTNIPINITQNIKFEIKNPIPFNEDWNLEHILLEQGTHILFSNYNFTDLLEKILSNDSNLNVIMENQNNEIGYVYKDNIEKYIKMNKEEIIDKTMEKLNKDLNKMIEERYKKIVEKYLNDIKNKIEEKFNNYINNNSMKNNVINCISNIYDRKKNDAIKISKNISDNNLSDINGY